MEFEESVQRASFLGLVLGLALRAACLVLGLALRAACLVPSLLFGLALGAPCLGRVLGLALRAAWPVLACVLAESLALFPVAALKQRVKIFLSLGSRKFVLFLVL